MPNVSKTDAGLPVEGSLPQYGAAAALAAAGTVIGNATAVAARFSTVSGADDAKGVILPSTASPGDEYLLYNEHATAGLKCYPHVNGDINDGSANAAVVIEGKTLARFIRMNDATWAGAFTANA